MRQNLARGLTVWSTESLRRSALMGYCILCEDKEGKYYNTEDILALREFHEVKIEVRQIFE